MIFHSKVMLGGMTLPTTREVELREKQIRAATTRRLGDQEINHMLREKEKFMQNPRLLSFICNVDPEVLSPKFLSKSKLDWSWEV